MGSPRRTTTYQPGCPLWQLPLEQLHEFGTSLACNNLSRGQLKRNWLNMIILALLLHPIS